MEQLCSVLFNEQKQWHPINACLKFLLLENLTGITATVAICSHPGVTGGMPYIQSTPPPPVCTIKKRKTLLHPLWAKKGVEEAKTNSSFVHSKTKKLISCLGEATAPNGFITTQRERTHTARKERKTSRTKFEKRKVFFGQTKETKD